MKQTAPEAVRPLRMRTAKGILAELKAVDPNTAVTLSFIRRIINSGKVPVVQAGKKKLVSLDLVLALLESGGEEPVEEVQSVPGIRRVEI